MTTPDEDISHNVAQKGGMYLPRSEEFDEGRPLAHNGFKVLFIELNDASSRAQEFDELFGFYGGSNLCLRFSGCAGLRVFCDIRGKEVVISNTLVIFFVFAILVYVHLRVSLYIMFVTQICVRYEHKSTVEMKRRVATRLHRQHNRPAQGVCRGWDCFPHPSLSVPMSAQSPCSDGNTEKSVR